MLSFNINVSALPISKSRRSSADGPGGSVTLHHPKPWWRLLLGDGLAGFVTYSILFICLFSSTSNALHFGRLMQLVIHPPEQNGCKPKTDKDGSDTWRPRRTEANMIGFLTFTTLCLIHYWFSGAGRRINKWTAVIKLAAVVALIIYGGSSYAGKASEDTDSNGNTKRSTEVGGEAGEDDNDVLRSARALLQILFSFQGWENATFVSVLPFQYSSAVLRSLYLKKRKPRLTQCTYCRSLAKRAMHGAFVVVSSGPSLQLASSTLVWSACLYVLTCADSTYILSHHKSLPPPLPLYTGAVLT